MRSYENRSDNTVLNYQKKKKKKLRLSVRKTFWYIYILFYHSVNFEVGRGHL